MTDRDHFVYRAYDADGRLLYIGCTKRPRQRWSTHRSWSRWAKSAIRFKVCGPYTYGTARQLEREALATEQPRHGFTPARRSAHARYSRAVERAVQRLMREGHDVSAAVAAATEEALVLVPEYASDPELHRPTLQASA